jgi:peptidoglycan/LPS O-acetylase OafA/YrhL
MATLLQSVAPKQHAAEVSAAAHLQYRPDVDGMRAIAVLAVIVFHAAPKLLPGGFVGVDIFFVISGFLISGIILRALSRESFSLLGFYARRIKRIFPALIVILVAIWVLGRSVLLSDEFLTLGKHIASGAGFIFNWTLYRDTKLYFGAITSPLIHLWSLGVEEQFYLFWPLFLLMTWKLPKLQLWAIIAAAVISFVLNVRAISSYPLAAFYLPWNRLWELALGGILAHAQLRLDTRLDSIAGGLTARWSLLKKLVHPHVRGFIGLVLILASFAIINEARAFPGWWALGPCVGAFLLISAGPQSWVNRYILSRRTMVFIGLISYPLYLWHWPLLSLAHTADWRDFTPMVKIGAVAVAFGLAALTYKYVERPIRTSQNNMQLARALFAVMIVCLGLGYLTFKTKIPSRQAPANVEQFVAAANENFPYPDDDGYVTVGTGARSVLFIGDSTLAQYYQRVKKLLADHPADTHQAVFAWKPGCAPDSELALINNKECGDLVQSAVEYARKPQVDTVVIGFCWYAYFVQILDTDHVGESGPLAPETDRALENVRRMITEFVKEGKRVYLVLQLPVDPGFAPMQMVERTVLSPGYRINARPVERAVLQRTFEPFVSRLLRIAQDTGANVIDPMNYVCGSTTCSALTPTGEPMYHDTWHLRTDYIREHVEYLDVSVLNGGSGSNSAQITRAANR